MCAYASAIIHWNAIPVFIDIDEKTFNIDPKMIETYITEKTKAIMAVDIFGHPVKYQNYENYQKNIIFKSFLIQLNHRGQKIKQGNWSSI